MSVQVSLPASNIVPSTQFQFDFDFERELLGLQTDAAAGPLNLGDEDAEPSTREETKASGSRTLLLQP